MVFCPLDLCDALSLVVLCADESEEEECAALLCVVALLEGDLPEDDALEVFDGAVLGFAGVAGDEVVGVTEESASAAPLRPTPVRMMPNSAHSLAHRQLRFEIGFPISRANLASASNKKPARAAYLSSLKRGQYASLAGVYSSYGSVPARKIVPSCALDPRGRTRKTTS